MLVSGVSYVNDLDSSGRDLTHVVATVTATGSTTIHTPAAGKRIRAHMIYAINDPDLSVNPLISVFLGAQEKYRVYALSNRQTMTGPVDGALTISLSEAASVAVTVLLEEI